MTGHVVLRGLAIGFSIAAPVGPIGILCIRRTLARGRAHGLVSGLGAATADALYGCVVAFGLALVGDWLLSWQAWLRVMGGLYLCYLGLRTALAQPSQEPARAAQWGSLLGAYGSTFLLTLTNPATMLSFAAVLAGMGVAAHDSGRAGLLVLGVFLGSALWWLVLSGVAGALSSRVTPVVLRWVNRVSGALISAFGVYALVAGLGAL